MSNEGTGSAVRILLIENDEDFRDELVATLLGATPNLVASVAGSRAEATEHLRESEFDLIVCDIRIPAAPGRLDESEAHGLAVAADVQAIAGGTPLVFLTGFATARNTREALRGAGSTDLFGEGQELLVDLLEKEERIQFVAHVASFATRLDGLDEFSITGTEVVNDPAVRILLRRSVAIYGRRKGAVSASISILGGLSGAVAARAAFVDSAGSTVASVFFKFGERHKLLLEKERYVRYVRGSLELGAFPPEAGSVMCNLGKRASLYYTVAERFTHSLFKVVEEDSDSGSKLVGSVRQMLDPWHARRESFSTRVVDLRRARIDDAKFGVFRATLEGVDEYEAHVVNGIRSVQHGDLHGENVLFDLVRGDGVLIDFGDVGPAPLVLDAVTLELSLVFHPSFSPKSAGWPSAAQAAEWWDLDEYLVGCPFPEFIRLCREWAMEADAGFVEPMIYAHACRQLKYGTNDEVAIALAQGCIRRWQRHADVSALRT